MRHVEVLLLCLAFLGGLSFAQSAPEQPGMDGVMKQENPQGMMGMHHGPSMSRMHEQVMKDMQGDLDSMRSNLQKMKDQLGKVSDRATRDQLQLNIDMWQFVVEQMDKRLDAMKRMMGAHHGPNNDSSKHEHPMPEAPKP